MTNSTRGQTSSQPSRSARREALPGLRRLAILANVGDPNTVRGMREVEAAAGTLAIEVAKLEIRRAEDITPAFEALKGGADALMSAATRS